MEYLKNRVLKQPSVKGAEEEVAIQTLSNRLQHATLAADRRSAVLGLKSFSRQFRESVVEYGLRPLLLTLDKDRDNAIMAKAILETLIILFLRGDKSEDDTGGWIASQSRIQNGKYPSPLLMTDVEVDQFSIWIADEVTAGEDHLLVFINILKESQDYHIRLYTLQLFEFLVTTRPTRTKECLLNIPLAVPTIVSLLNDVYDPVRNEAILVLMALVNNNFNIQKLVAFENTFDRLFEIIDEEGGIRGSIVVQDCLTLLTNLLMYNASNQKYFLETEGVPKLAKLLAEPIEETLEDGMHDEYGNPIVAPPIIWTEQRLQNMSIALEICKSFVNEDDPDIRNNQDKLFQAGIFFCTMRLVFSPLTENPIRKTALQITGDLIAGNSELQLQFSQVDVPYLDPSLPTQLQKFEKPIPAPVALLNWTLLSNSVHIFEIRLAAAYCLRCFFKDNAESKIAFLTDQARASQNPNYYDEMNQASPVDDEKSTDSSEKVDEVESIPATSTDENLVKTPIANIFTTLMDFSFDNKLNPYRVWFAATILIYLFEDCPENRQLARELKVGDAEEGEEVMTSIQAISGILITTLDDQDPRIAIGLMLLLTIWLYEDFDAVNDFLGDSSLIKSIVAFLSKNSAESSDLVLGMGSILVGISYEFSQKSSPIPRTEMHSLVTKGLGANNYALKVKQFKDCEEFRDFADPLSEEVERDATGLPKVYFISIYVDLIKDNYYRIRKALSHNPQVEPHIKISYELLEELEKKNGELAITLQECKDRAALNEANLKEQLDKAKEEFEETQSLLEISNAEVGLLRESEAELTEKIELISNELKRIENEKSKFEKDSVQFSAELNKISKQNYSNEGSLNHLKQKLADSEAAKTKAEDGINKMSRELFQLTREKKDLEGKISKLEKEVIQLKTYSDKTVKDYESQLNSARKTNEELRSKIKILEQQLRDLSSERENTSLRMRELQAHATDAETGNEHLMEKLRTAASVVQDLRSSNQEYSQQVEQLKLALTNHSQSTEEIQTLHDEMNTLKHRNQTLESMMNSMKEHVNQNSDTALKGLLTALEEKSKHEINIKALTLEVESLKQNLSSESADLQSSKSSYQSALQQLELKDREIGQINSFLQDLVSKVDSLNESLRTSKENESLLQIQLQDKEREISSAQNELAETVESASNLQSALEEELTNIRDQLVKHESSTTQLKEDYNCLKKEYHELQAQFQEVKDSQGDARGLSDSDQDTEKSENCGKEIDELKDRLLKKDDAISLAESKIKLLEDETKTLSKDAAERGVELERLQHNFEEKQEILSSTITELEKAKELLTDELKMLKEAHSEQLQNLRSEHDEQMHQQLDLHVKSRETDHNETQALLEKQNSDLARLNSDHQLLKEEYESTKLVLQELQAKAANYEEAKSLAEQRASELEETLANLEKELGKAQSEKDALSEKLRKMEEELETEALDKDSTQHYIQQNGTGDIGVKDVLTREISNKISELMAKDQLISDIKRKLENSTIALEELTERNEELENSEKLRLQLEKRIQVLERDMENAVNLNDNLNQELDDKTEELKQKVLEIEADINSHNEEISNHLGIEKELTKQIQSLEKELKKRVADHEKDRKLFSGGTEPILKQYEEEVAELNRLIESLKVELDTQLKEKQVSFEDKISSIENEKQTLFSRCQELSTQIAALESSTNEWNCKENEHQATIKELKDSLEEQKETLRLKEDRVKELESELTEKANQLEVSLLSLSEKENELSLKKGTDSTMLKQVQEDLDAAKKDAESKEVEINHLRSQIELSASESIQQEQNVRELEIKLTEKSKVNMELEHSISELRYEIVKLQDELDKSTSVIEEKTREITELQDNIEAAAVSTKTSEEHQMSIDKLKSEIQEVRQKLREVENEREELVKKSTDAEIELERSMQKSQLTEKAFEQEVFLKATEVERLAREVSSLRGSQSTLEKENNLLKTRLENNALSKAQLESEIKSVADELELRSLADSKHTKKILLLESMAKESDELVFELKTKLGDYVEEKMNLESELEKSKSDYEQLKSDLKDKEAVIEDLQKSEQQMNGHLAQVERLENELKLETETLTETSMSLAQTATLLDAERNLSKIAREENDNLSKEISKLRLESETAQQHWKRTSAEVKTVKERLEEELDEYKSKLQKAESELRDARKEIMELTMEVTKVKHDLESPLSSTGHSQENDNNTLNTEIASLKEQLAAKQNVEADFEDLVLLWEEQEKKMMRYKSQLVALGQYESSEEEDDSDDNEEEG